MKKPLVAFFSASGTTAKVAKSLAEAAGADLFEIRPEVPYTFSDLNWQNYRSRSYVEMHEKASRPALAEDTLAEAALDVSGYDTIFLGFPIWWGIAPTIVNTFLERYDFTGKKIILFATSGSDGIGHSADALRGSAPGAIIVDGRMLNGSPSVEELKAWVEQVL